MQTNAIVAEQTSRNRYWRLDNMPPQEIELTVRLEIPEESGADVGIDSTFEPRLPEDWESALEQRLYQGVHGGIASVGAPLPHGGIGIHIVGLRVLPPLKTGADADDIRRLGDTLEALAAATVGALWSGVLSLSAPSIS